MSSYNVGDPVQSLGQEDLLEKEMAAHSNILAWKIPWMVESGRLQSMGSQRVRHDWATSLLLFIQVWTKSNPLWVYSGDNRYIQGIRSGRQSTWRTMDGDSWFTIRNRYLVFILFPAQNSYEESNDMSFLMLMIYLRKTLYYLSVRLDTRGTNYMTRVFSPPTPLRSGKKKLSSLTEGL